MRLLNSINTFQNVDTKVMQTGLNLIEWTIVWLYMIWMGFLKVKALNLLIVLIMISKFGTLLLLLVSKLTSQQSKDYIHQLSAIVICK